MPSMRAAGVEVAAEAVEAGQQAAAIGERLDGDAVADVRLAMPGPSGLKAA